MTATVILFRRPQPANTFCQRDIAELHRWVALAARTGLFFQTDHDPKTGEGRWIGRADCGSECVSAAAGSPAGRTACVMTPEGGQWVLRDSLHGPLATFGTLRGRAGGGHSPVWPRGGVIPARFRARPAMNRVMGRP